MRNGVSIAFVSELAHEIRERPEEGQFIYRATARRDDARGMECRVNTATAGSIRAARNFVIPLPWTEPATAGRADLPSAATELALIGLAACALTTSVLASTTTRQTISRALVSLTHGSCAHGMPQELHYVLTMESSHDASAVRSVVEGVLAHSPNHRTFVEPCPLEVTVLDADSRPEGKEQTVGAHVALNESGSRHRHSGRDGLPALQVRWDYGVQLSTWPRVGDSIAGAHYLVDQPKQLGGIDRGPNPQEYLLAGLATSLLEALHRLATARDLKLGSLVCSCEGRVDVRGIMGVDESVPARVQDLHAYVQASHPHGRAQLERLVAEAAELSPVARLLREPLTIEVEARDGAESIGSWSSHA
jgi:uncharacterized OsmC-like protein